MLLVPFVCLFVFDLCFFPGYFCRCSLVIVAIEWYACVRE